tara:strand:+ start:592 stop:816 length:225 start_codon:yes stop_codon:yes gene_type:complete
MTDEEVLNKLKLLIESFDLNNWNLVIIMSDSYSKIIKRELWEMMNSTWITSVGLHYKHLVLINYFKLEIDKYNV